LKELSVSLDIINTLGPTSAIVLAVIQQNKIPTENFDELISVLNNYLKFENRENLILATQKLLKLKLIGSSDSATRKKDNLYKLKLPGKSQAGSKKQITSNWQPNEEVYEVMLMGGVSKEFCANKLKEFRIYWCEKGLLKDNWNSIFVDFVRREWVKEKSPNKGAPSQMHRGWQPSKDAFEVLELANIPKNVSQSYILEFVLFWEEDGVALKSWNSKFVDFVKRKEIVNTINNEENKRSDNKEEGYGESSEQTKDLSWSKDLEL
jgi:hypothetical protein